VASKTKGWQKYLAVSCTHGAEADPRALDAMLRLKEAWKPLRVSLIIAGFEVPHTHLHLIPADDMGDLSFARARSASKEELADAASLLRATLRTQGNKEADF
jgi:hypothetical protein